GYTAPSVKGQTEVILEAQAAADIHPDDISYIEAHGTGTPLGDPIEIQALTQAFRTSTQRQGYCALGSVKTNIGHADAAAGIAGLIKTVLALKQRQLPPSLHFNKPNPHIDFEQSPFFVNERLRNWEAEERCAGVSAFGIGGTNAHLIVAQAPKVKASGASRPLQLITLSAKTVSALQTATSQLAQWLHHHADLSLADVAYTLNRGRQHFAYRRVLVCAQLEEAYAQLLTPGQSYHALNQAGQVALLFPGQGSQYIGMTQGLYATERVFQHALEQCAQILSTHLEHDLREILYHNPNSQLLNQTVFTQPILFAVEYALAQLWLSWGIQPQALLGHSLGEYVAACLAGVFSLEEALTLVAVRGQLIQSSPAGALLALPLSEQALQPWLTPNLSLAAVNGAERCVLSGDRAAIETVQQQLRAQGIESRRVQAEHGFHSHLLTPILAAFKQQMQKITLNKPKIPFLSNLTGTWIAPEQAVDPDYWVQHLRYPVRFNDNLHSLCQHNIELLLEVGPGQTLSSLARQHSARFSVFSSLPQQKHPESSAEMTHLLSTLGQLWAHGVTVNWEGFYAAERRHRLPLPTYPFERKRYWLDTPQQKQNDKPVQEKKAAQPLAPAKFQAPSTPLEAQLAEIWQLFLGVSSVGVEDDFFELGGDSLLAVQLAAHLRTQWRVQVGPQALLTAPTIARLAQLIEHNTHDSSAALLVELKAGLSQRLPLFMVHPIGGHVFSYRALAKHLAAEQPVYGIQVQHVDAQRSQIEPMATHYIHHLKTRQPKGPYCLGGASFGGVVAYEMAQQLSQQGEPIALLALIDTPEPGNRVDNTLNDEVEIMAYIVNL
ncbi:MAG: acyltransferase domain-containing protein, partial [Pseudomonadota bacterium]|nr:acyltransferase domain-containing protein [Pseudomonadota bacterium]